MSISRFILRLVPFALGASACALTPLTAQPPGTEALTVNVYGSYSAKTDLDVDGQQLGELSVAYFQFSAESSTALGERTQLGGGLDYTHVALDRSGGVPLPDTLQSLSVPLSVGGQLAPGWFGRLMVRPGVYGSDLSFSSHELNAPVVAFASYRQSPTLSWTVGLRYDAWSEYPVLPIAGGTWRFAPNWDLTVGMPRTGVSWQFHPDAILRVGASYQGGSYYLREDPTPNVSKRVYLGRTTVDYRTIRVGAALDLFSRRGTSIVLDAGASVILRVDYDRADFTVDGSSAAYVALSARFRF